MTPMAHTDTQTAAGTLATASGTRTETCAWCGAGIDALAPRRRGRVLCARCGAFTTSPWPDDATLDAAYGGAYRPTSGRFSGPGDRLLAFTRSRLAARIDRIAPPGGVLDVGAGPGSLVRALRGRGRPALGLERTDVAPAGRSDEAAAEPALSGPLVIDAPLSDVRGACAAAVYWHSLEHLPRPLVSLREAVALLVPGGVVAIAVPNAASLQARVFGDAWLHLDPPRHLVHLSPSSLREGLEQELGLHIDRVSYWRGGQVMIGWLHGLVRALPGHPSLYDALRQPQARWEQMGSSRRAAIVLAAVVLAPVAAIMSLLEIAARRGGSVYVEAHRA